MPSRRIVSSPNLAPVQDNAVNPFGTFNSDTVNKLTRIVSKGSDGVICGLDVEPLMQPKYTSIQYNFPEDLTDVSLKNVVKVEDAKQYYIYNASSDNIHYSQFELAFIQFSISDDDITKYQGQNVTKVFEFCFDIVSGNPKQIIAFVDNDIQILDYPRYSGSSCSISVKHNFLYSQQSKNLKVGLKFNLDILDERTQYSTNSEGKTYIKITIPEVKIYDISSTLDKNDYVSYTIGGDVPNNKIHPISNCKVTKGMAIKDDVVLNPTGIFNSNIDSIVHLNIADERCWIKEDPYKIEDFSGNGKQQLLFLNGSNYKLDDAIIDPVDGRLKGEIIPSGSGESVESSEENLIIYQVNDYELCDWDREVNLVDIVKSESNISVTIPSMPVEFIYGNTFLLYYIENSTKKVFKKVTAQIADRNGSKETIATRITIDSFGQSNIYCVQSGGPVKVSGTKNEYNKDMVKFAHVVCYYSYFKHPEPNVSYYGLIKDEDLNDLIFQEDYLVLATLRMTDTKTFDIISYDIRQELKPSPGINAYDVLYSNQLINGEKGFYELDCWRKEPDVPLESGDIPSNVSRALTELATRRLNDAFNIKENSNKIKQNEELIDDIQNDISTIDNKIKTVGEKIDKIEDSIIPDFSSVSSGSIAYWDIVNKTLKLKASNYTVDDVSKLSDLPKSDSSGESKIVYYANNKLNVSNVTVDDVSKLSDLPESDSSGESKIVYYANNKLNISDATIDDLSKLNNIEFDNTDDQYVVSANKDGLNKSNISIKSLSNMSTDITKLSEDISELSTDACVYINDSTFIHSVDYDNSNDVEKNWLYENNKYSKPYKMAANGTLLISFRWDCNGADGIGYEILKSNGETLIEQKLTENVEFNNSSGLHVNMSLNLGKDITFRFVSENGFLNSENTFLQYRACYKEDPNKNNE